MKARIPNSGSNASMMNQLKKMQDDMARAQSDVEAGEYSASAGGGAVDVTVNGSHEIKSITIKPEVVDPEDIEMLQDLLIAALNEAMRKATDTMEREMNKITGGMNIPGLNGLM